MPNYEIEQMLDFLREIKRNNNTEWMHANKAMYERARDNFKALSTDILIKMQAIDPSLAGLEVKNCIFRFNRDTRFSLDKAPYKRHFGAYFCPGGKKKVAAGYYLHIQPFDADDEMFGQSLTDIGLYMPPPKAAKMIREEIFYGGGERLQEILNRQEIKDNYGASFEQENMLKVLPKNLKDSPYDQLIRMKNWDMVHLLSDEDCLRSDFADYIVELFRMGKDLNDFFNEIIADEDFQSCF